MLKDDIIYFTTQLTLSKQLQDAVGHSIDTLEVSDANAASISMLFPGWLEGVGYNQNNIRRYNGKLYRCNQAHTSSAEYNPTVASLWTEIQIAPDGIMIWHQPGGAHDAPKIGDKVHYPGAEDPVYMSKIDGNTTIPGSDERWWELVG